MKTINNFIRNDIADMKAYTPSPRLLEKKNWIKLDAGENAFGYSPTIRKALVSRCEFNRYPDPEYTTLRRRIAKYAGVRLESIIVGNGSDELLDLLFRLLLNIDDEVISCPPTFGMYEPLITLNRGIVVSVPRNTDFSINAKGILQAITPKTTGIVICSPNNPTGTVTSQESIILLLKTGIPVIVDEAYYEFCGKTVVPLVSVYENLIVLRTFSKWAGLAGIRLGYGSMSPVLVKQLFKIKPPYNVNTAACIAGIASLDDTAWQKKTISTIIKERERLTRSLQNLPYLTVYPSGANSLFITIRTNTDKLKQCLEMKNIAVRYFPNYQSIRLSVGTKKQNDNVLRTLKEFGSTLYDGIIFDMDGVLIDVSSSYRMTIKKTVEYILKKEYGINTIVIPKDIEEMKKIPGFNNDWDLTFELIRLLKSGTRRNEFASKAQMVRARRKCMEYINVKNLFQKYYLGAGEPGFIDRENILIDISILRALSAKYTLGVATSRPRFEALYTLKKFGITPSIIQEQYIVAQEDAIREKPAPDPLIEAKRRIGSTNPLYIGDSINDAIAAKRARMPYTQKTVNEIAEVLI